MLACKSIVHCASIFMKVIISQADIYFVGHRLGRFARTREKWDDRFVAVSSTNDLLSCAFSKALIIDLPLCKLMSSFRRKKPAKWRVSFAMRASLFQNRK